METQIGCLLHEKIVDYYVKAGMDYAYWSKSRNMHFGFASLRNVFSRESMLNRMSDEVINKLQLNARSSLLADLGCGVGSVARRAARKYPALSAVGVTIVPIQKKHGEEYNREENLDRRVSIRVEDYHCTSFDNDSCDGVLMMESACYSPAHLNETLFSEVYRITKPGGYFAIGDGFLKISSENLPREVRRNYVGICRNWSMPGMMQINQTEQLLMRTGFKGVTVEEVSWKVAPSVLHVPFVIIRFLLDKIITGERLSQQSIRNLQGSFLALLLGLRRKYFGYYLISAQK